MGPAVETARCGGELNVMWVQRGVVNAFGPSFLFCVAVIRRLVNRVTLSFADGYHNNQ
jgi:hypothetical protein